MRVQGLATQLDDYVFGTFIGATVVIPAGSTTLDIAVNVLDDFLTEGTEDARIRPPAPTVAITAPGASAAA